MAALTDEQIEAQVKEIESKIKETEKEYNNLQVDKKMLTKSLNEDSKALAELGYTVNSESQARELLGDIQPKLVALLEVLQSKLGIEG